MGRESRDKNGKVSRREERTKGLWERIKKEIKVDKMKEEGRK